MLMGDTKSENYEQLIDELMSTHGQDILQLVYAYVHNETIAEDLTQEIFVKCYKGLPSYRGRSSIKTWLWRIAINHAKDYLKSWYNQNVRITEDTFLNRATLSSSVEQIIVQQDEDASLAAAVMSLPIKYREVIYLAYFEELTMREAAAVLQLNENTIKTRLRKGKLLLKNILEGSEWKND
ncbi:sigma-70 family RNA polymerase sigma factor [Psychrobacillus sp. FSL K6-4046]|uniref:sigma-70 family RNA polymerase sigma factor n=1 Tax=Psychrobacillus sp. FSL K6-4046 TaxID=2921550 RepID=UPI00315A38B4